MNCYGLLFSCCFGITVVKFLPFKILLRKQYQPTLNLYRVLSYIKADSVVMVLIHESRRHSLSFKKSIQSQP